MSDLLISIAQKTSWERVFFPEPDKTKQLEKLVEIIPKAPPKASPKEPSVSDEDTLLYQIQHILDSLRQLEIHLSEGCKINTTPCDCCIKHALDTRTFAAETISIASRMELDTKIFSDIVLWAKHIESISSEEQVASGNFDAEYTKESGTASKFRKELQRIRDELKPKGFGEMCEECKSLEDLKTWLEKRKAERK